MAIINNAITREIDEKIRERKRERERERKREREIKDRRRKGEQDFTSRYNLILTNTEKFLPKRLNF